MNLIYVFGNLLGRLMSLIYNLINNYGLSIILFTFLTKILLFPLNMLMQKNSINMVRLMPDENALKIKYIDDKDKLADERLVLYKRYNYHPILGTIPLLIQIPLILGLVYVIYRPLSFIFQLEPDTIIQLKDWISKIVGPDHLQENSYQLEIINSIRSGITPDLPAISDVIENIRSLNMSFLSIDLSLTPSFHENYILLLIPLISGLSAWIMCVVQNRINILQLTQSTLNKTLTTMFMIAFSTYFAFLVPAGVGLYWIFGNLFSIPSMFLLNMVMPPGKYVDLDYLKKMNEQRIAKEKKYKKYRAREKASYQEFFSVNHMQLMFYSEQNGFYKYYSAMIDYICEHSHIQIHYVTSDPNDAIFSDSRKQIHPYYIASDKYLIPLFRKLECDMCVMTTPDLEKYHIKRSRVKKDVEYVFACHGIGSISLYRKGALDWFDTIFCPGIDQFNEIRATEEVYQLPKKCLVETGYPLIDEMIEVYDSSSHTPNTIPKILIAPSWQPNNIIDLCIDQLLDKLTGENYEIILRPHPQQVRHEPEKFNTLKEKYQKYSNIEIQTDFSSNSPVMEADILITDWSDISWEFSFVTKRPVLFIDTPMKIMNPEYEKIKITPINISLRNVIGKSVSPDALDSINSIIKEMLENKEKYKDTITSVREEHIYNIGKSKILCGKYIIKSLQNKI